MKKICEKHGEYEAKEYKGFTGNPIYTMCPICEAEEREAEEKREAIEADRKRKDSELSFYKCSGISERFYNSTFDNYRISTEPQQKVYELVKKYYAMFSGNRVSYPLFLIGSYGTGKTHLAIALLKALYADGNIRYPLYTTTMKMIRDIRSSYHHKSDETEQEIIDRYIRKDFLILDEVGLQNGTDNEKLLIYEVLNGRYENMLPTVLISNYGYEELKAYLGERVIDRLKGKGGIMAVFNWQSERGKI